MWLKNVITLTHFSHRYGSKTEEQNGGKNIRLTNPKQREAQNLQTENLLCHTCKQRRWSGRAIVRHAVLDGTTGHKNYASHCDNGTQYKYRITLYLWNHHDISKVFVENRSVPNSNMSFETSIYATVGENQCQMSNHDES